MSWSPAKASTWLKNYADDVARSAYDSGGDAMLYACAGAAYYAVLYEVGYNSERDFKKFFLTHLELGKPYLDEVLQELKT
jgi:hypothetical protein